MHFTMYCRIEKAHFASIKALEESLLRFEFMMKLFLRCKLQKQSRNMEKFPAANAMRNGM